MNRQFKLKILLSAGDQVSSTFVADMIELTLDLLRWFCGCTPQHVDFTVNQKFQGLIMPRYVVHQATIILFQESIAHNRACYVKTKAIDLYIGCSRAVLNKVHDLGKVESLQIMILLELSQCTSS